MGRREVAGRPILYGTSRKFLEYLGLKSISEMPSLEEFKEQDLELEGDPPLAPSQKDIPFDKEDLSKNDNVSNQKSWKLLNNIFFAPSSVRIDIIELPEEIIY